MEEEIFYAGEKLLSLIAYDEQIKNKNLLIDKIQDKIKIFNHWSYGSEKKYKPKNTRENKIKKNINKTRFTGR